MSVDVSEASAADAEEISALAIKTYVDTFGAEFEPDELAHHLEQTISVPRWREHFVRDRVLVARLAGRAVGYVHFGPDEQTGEVAIHRLYVAAEMQGRGIGTMLLSRALAQPEVAAAPMVRIDVWENNHDARRLYERFGFRHEGGMEPFILKSGEIDGYDLILVRRALPRLELNDGRRVFGAVAATYDGARPRYPDAVFELLREHCGLGPGTRVFEVGPGTGLATRPLLAAGAAVVAVEPDGRMAAVLRDSAGPERLQGVVAAFENADLPEAGFDLGCAATAFHWLDQRPALAKVTRLLRPGGYWAMWWHVFGDPEQPNPFHDATQQLLAPLGTNPSHPKGRTQHFGLDREDRMADLESVGQFEDLDFELLRWTLVVDAEQVRALYATFSHIAVLEEGKRERILDGLHEIAATQFGGRVERHMLTPLYTCRRKA